MGQSSAGHTWVDLRRSPDDGLRRELIDGEFLVTPPPAPRHQRVVRRLVLELNAVVEPLGGEVLPAPVDVVFDRSNVAVPDVVVVLPRHSSRLTEHAVEGPPDLAVEVSSPSTKGVDRLRKRALYERFGVAEYWIVDLDEPVIEVYVLDGEQYTEPRRFRPGDTVVSAVLPGLAVPFERLVPPS